MVPWSPLSRNRGSVVVSTTGSRTVTSVVARPSFVAVHATAITRAVPANSGMSKLISAVPSLPTVTIPEYSASGFWVGGLPWSSAPAESPPVLIWPRVPCMPSINCP